MNTPQWSRRDDSHEASPNTALRENLSRTDVARGADIGDVGRAPREDLPQAGYPSSIRRRLAAARLRGKRPKPALPPFQGGFSAVFFVASCVLAGFRRRMPQLM